VATGRQQGTARWDLAAAVPVLAVLVAGQVWERDLLCRLRWNLQRNENDCAIQNTHTNTTTDQQRQHEE
jgi:hypothetical protein